MMVRPSVKASTLASWPSSRSSMISSIAGLAEDAPDHDLVDRLERLAEVVADVNALARGQSVGLQDHVPGAGRARSRVPRRPC